MGSVLTRSFLAALPPERRGACEESALEPLLTAAGTAARAVWPGIDVGDEAFGAHLAKHLPPEGDLAHALAALRLDELYLACGCAHRDPVALQQLEDLYFADIDAAYARYAYLGRTLDDVRQAIREDLFVGSAARAPKIGTYAGRGTLRSWLRAVVANTLVNVLDRQSREIPVDEDMFAAVTSTDDPEVSHLKDLYRDELQQAFVLAVEELGARDKNVLRYALADSLSVDEIGAIYGVHRSTAARWVVEAKEVFSRHIRRILKERLKLSDTEFASVLRLAVSQIDLTLARYLEVRAPTR